jgi:uncharacterized membrane protein YagU involved in acid resistance
MPEPDMRVQKRFGEVTAGSVAKGAIAGLAGGLAGSWVMTLFQDLLFSRADPRKEKQEVRSSQFPLQPDSPTEIVADKLSQATRGEPLSDEYRPTAGQMVHIGYGVAMGGAYGVLTEFTPQVSRGLGVPWGVGVWLITNEIGLTVLKLSPPPHKHPLRVHLTALGLHVVYGLTTHGVYTGVRQLLEGEAPVGLLGTALRGEGVSRSDYADFTLANA